MKSIPSVLSDIGDTYVSLHGVPSLHVYAMMERNSYIANLWNRLPDSVKTAEILPLYGEYFFYILG